MIPSWTCYNIYHPLSENLQYVNEKYIQGKKIKNQQFSCNLYYIRSSSVKVYTSLNIKIKKQTRHIPNLNSSSMTVRVDIDTLNVEF